MRLAFLILAHERPEQVVELARTLVEAARDGVALVHYDSRAPATEFAQLEVAAAAEPRLRLVARRVAGRWGSFGLVEAPLNALAQIEAEGLDPDYVVLLSGACLPCRPIASLERYLADNAGREFIEVEDASWVGNGWRDERWQHRFWFNHKTQRPAEWGFFQIQRLLGLKRRFPEGLTPRFGSQWWTLTWDTCRAILTDIRRDPKRMRFFRSVWIPDEMMIQTYVHALVHPDEIAGFPLTHFQFSNRGKPVVFHDDHADYVRGLDHFFVRKVSPRAAKLRAQLLAVAGMPDDGAPLDAIGRRRQDYALKVRAQTYYPVPGQVFYRDQWDDMTDSVLAADKTPYVVLLGPPALTRLLAVVLDASKLTVLGEIFAPGGPDFGPDRDGFGGFAREDGAIRDLHPALFLARVRARCKGVPVLTWSPLHQGTLLEAVLRDPNALVVACLPFSCQETRDRELLTWACLPGAERAAAAEALPGVAPAQAWRARIDVLGEESWVFWLLGGALFHPASPGGATRLAQDAQVVLPWTLMDAPDTTAERWSLLERSFKDCRFRVFPWFAGLEADLRAFWKRELQDATRVFGPPPEEGSPPGLALGEAATPRPAGAALTSDRLRMAAEGMR